MLVEIGQILKPRGLKGELKVEIWYNRPQVFGTLKQVTINQKMYQVIRGSVQNGYGYLSLAGVDTIEKAEPFRNQIVAVPDSALHLAPDEVLSSQLLGFAVWHQGRPIGTLTAVENYGGGDFFEIAVTGQGVIQIPNEDEFIAETNLTEHRITLTPRALDEELV